MMPDPEYVSLLVSSVRGTAVVRVDAYNCLYTARDLRDLCGTDVSVRMTMYALRVGQMTWDSGQCT